MIFSLWKSQIRDNLDDLGIRQFSDASLQASLQDAYNDITAQSGCIIKRLNAQSFTSNLVYYNFRTLVSDFLGVLAIFNVSSNRWLEDDINLKQMDQVRSDWELMTGTPRWWIPCSPDIIALVPKYLVATGKTYNLYYCATAPTVVDADEPLIVTDMQDLFEYFVTADQLEQHEEFTKANAYWEMYYPKLDEYRERVKKLSKADLLLIA